MSPDDARATEAASYVLAAYRERVLAKINEGLQDIAEGRTYSHEEVGRMIEARFAPPTRKKRR